jgi:hypothetical protein
MALDGDIRQRRENRRDGVEHWGRAGCYGAAGSEECLLVDKSDGEPALVDRLTAPYPAVRQQPARTDALRF